MKQTVKFFAIALLSGVLTLAGYKTLIEKKQSNQEITLADPPTPFVKTAFTNTPAPINTIDFTEAAEKAIHAVVHVKNTTIINQPVTISQLFYGGGEPRARIGSGSGVIISPDGYIITNNHVIANATELEVTLNDNKIYTAKLIGTDPKTDIALIKVNANEALPYMTFGDSNMLRLGEWVLAVGNPFNLNSTVTAGIVSAKARDLNEFDGQVQSFIQTDAAVNRGNSGGALVNTRGELVGINTAITSETGSYVGYSFAVPANIARKVVEDIMEYGNVQRGILGIIGANLNSRIADELGISKTEGIYVDDIEKGTGADKAGIKKGDIITGIDGFKIERFSDLVGYLGSKRPNDVVEVTLFRNGKEKNVSVTLIKLEVYEIADLGLEVKNISKEELKERGLSHGVKVSKALTKEMKRYNLEGIIITEINDKNVNTIDDVKNIINARDYRVPLKVTFADDEGNINTFIFR